MIFDDLNSNNENKNNNENQIEKEAKSILHAYQSFRKPPLNKRDQQNELIDHLEIGIQDLEDKIQGKPENEKVHALKSLLGVLLGALNYLSWELANEKRGFFSFFQDHKVEKFLLKKRDDTKQKLLKYLDAQTLDEQNLDLDCNENFTKHIMKLTPEEIPAIERAIKDVKDWQKENYPNGWATVKKRAGNLGDEIKLKGNEGMELS